MLGRLVEALRGSGDPRDQERADVVAGMLRERGSDIDERPVGPSLVISLEQAVNEYRRGVTPESATALWQTFWGEMGQRVGLELTVEAFSGDAEKLAEHLQNGDMPIYIPSELAGQEKRHWLGAIWPEMASYSVSDDNSVSNEEVRGGWRYVEASLDAPYLGLNESDLKKKFEQRGRVGHNETEYIIGSQMSKVLTGHYFDERTWSLLLSSRDDGDLVRANFHPDGRLYVARYWLPEVRNLDGGGRSSEEC